MRAAHGSKKLPDACRAYRDEVGWPSSSPLIGMFLDTGDSDLMAGVLESLLAFKRAGCDGILSYFAIAAARALQ